ncbi:hypothetical protein DH86_00000896 [Scytalidium sp. 3C]|nr:hypothetical protein DH86_00000896 [Scytalidium sp. 3C]
MAAASAEEKNNIRAGLQGRMDAQTFQRYQQQGIDPLLVFFRNQAITRFRAEKNARQQAQQAQQAQLAMGQQPQNVPGSSTPMQPQRSMGPSPMPGQAQPAGNANPEFNSFLGNTTMESIIGQQQQAGVMAQEAGQVVVPASGAQRNATPQMGMAGQGMNQRPPPNATQAQQQQFLASQQAQQRMLHNAQQTQAQLRANAQQKAQMSLQGQPGGLGPGPMPPRQSPAMPTLNAPVPGAQQVNPETPQMNANGQLGQPLDPRFMQNNQRPMGQANGMNGLNSALFANMPIEQQNRLSTLPPDRLNEVLARWHAQQTAQGGRPQVPMQGNNQVRPGQPNPQAGQFGPQNPMNQFLNAQGGQQRPQGMQGAMNPQQQLALQQQIARLQNPAAQQRAQMTPEQRFLMQMDNVDFPRTLLDHPQMPRGVPQELKKWGQLKQWASQNPSVLPEQVETMKGLQKIHYQQIIRARQNQQQGQAMGMNPAQPGQAGMPGVAPGMSAPVAQMGANPMQGAGMNMGPNGPIRAPTMMEIQNVRNHPSGKMAGATDDQIRAVLMRHQMTPQQQQQRQQQMLQMQMPNNMQMNAGQRPGAPQGQMQQNGIMGQAQQQSMPAQMQQSKSASGADATAARAKPQAKGAPTSSPAQPANKLKRASSDDVVEVPNPNSQPATQQQTQRPNLPAKGPQANRPTLTPQQIQNLDPEARKRYEQALRASQANQAGGQNNNADIERLKAIMQEEVVKAREPLPDLPMDAETKAAMAKLLRDILTPLANVGKAVPKWYQLTHDQTRARLFFRTVSSTDPLTLLILVN